MKRAIMIAMLLAAPAFAQAPASPAPSGGGDSAGSASNTTAAPVTGEQVYVQVCQACHMADGKGGEGAGHIPALAKNKKLEEPGYPIGMIIQGRSAMPPMGDMLKPAQIAAVVTYVRSHFGNHYKAPVKEADVKAMLGQ
jgi:mono/diheme cytochrome c family protein